MNRRDFLKAIGIVTGSSLIGGCKEKGEDKIVSSLNSPEKGIIPGVSYHRNTTCTECPAQCGITATIRDGNTYKLEGAAGHPINDGALCIRGQASITRLYNSDRIRAPMRKNAQDGLQYITWEQAYKNIQEGLNSSHDQHRKNVYLSGRTTGALADLIDDVCKQTGIERIPEYEVYSHATLREAYRILFGRREVPGFANGIGASDFLLTLGADIVETFVSPVANAGQLAKAKGHEDFRWAHVEPHVSLEGLKADMPLVLAPGSEAILLAYLLNRMVSESWYSRSLPSSVRAALPTPSLDEAATRTGLSTAAITRLTTEFHRSKNPTLIAGGVSLAQESGLETAMLAGLIQWFSGMTEDRIDFTHAENYTHVGSAGDVEVLSNQLKAGKVGLLFVTRTNPVATLPASFAFKENFRGALLRVGLTDCMTETMNECDVILPLSHPLESWGDAEPRRGLRTVIQPTRERLFDTKSEGDVLLDLMQMQGNPRVADSYEKYLKQRWAATFGSGSITSMLAKGYHETSVLPVSVQLNPASTAEFLARAHFKMDSSTPVLMIAPSLRTFDGRGRSLKLLSEIPDPVTTITYGDWISISKGNAKSMQLQDGDEVEISGAGWKARLPVKVQPRLSDRVYVVQRGSISGPAVQVDRRTGESYAHIAGIKVMKTGQAIALPILSGSSSQKGRGIIPDPVHLKEGHGPGRQGQEERQPTLYPEQEYKQYRWAMSIDLDKCIGCSACVAACYIENNVPIAGPEEHVRGREMSWIRIEPFYDREPGADFIPMMCQQCDKAPCESVCPVFATYHNPEGLNVQVYNRCVGTRYCSNNCPYKVRRFNWFDHQWPDPLDKMQNPDIFTRGRGVMEKCTFCVQRIRAAHDHAKDESRLIRDGEMVPACAQTCPTKAIEFGNKLDETSRVAKAIESDGAYRVFDELGTGPAVYYLGGKKTENED